MVLQHCAAALSEEERSSGFGGTDSHRQLAHTQAASSHSSHEIYITANSTPNLHTKSFVCPGVVLCGSGGLSLIAFHTHVAAFSRPHFSHSSLPN
jgi:hypothetical protein